MMTKHVKLLSSLFIILLSSNLGLADITYFIPGQNTVLETRPFEKYLKDFKTVIDTVNNTLTLTSTADEGIYSPIVSSPTHSHILPGETKWFVAASLCKHNLSDVLWEVPPVEFHSQSTAVVPCSVVGHPKPIVWWQVSLDGDFANLTLTERVFLSPNNHLIIKNATDSDSGTYRCVGWNKCGSRCTIDHTCQTDQTTTGDPITITVSTNSPISPNKAYFLNIKLNPFAHFNTDCFVGNRDTRCINLRQFSKRQFGGSMDAVFIGDPDFLKIDRDGVDGRYDNNEFGICMFECLKNSSNQSLDPNIKPLPCNDEDSEEELTTSCYRVNLNTSQFVYSVTNSINFIPDIKLGKINDWMKLSENSTRIQFFTSQEVEVEHSDIRDWTCYQNNKEIVADFRTSVTKIKDRRNDRHIFSINKFCLARSDVGDYFCKITDSAGHISLSSHTSVLGVQKYDDCMDVALKTKTTTSVQVSWSPINDSSAEYLVVQPLPCRFGGRGCGIEELTVPLSSNQTVANITGLTPGCCYGVTVFLASGSILAENRNVSEYKTTEAPPKTQTTRSMNYKASYFNNDKLRIWWTEPDRWTWGSDTLTYEVTRGSITQSRMGYNYLVVDELLTEGQALQYGVMRLCNAAGCSAPHDIVVTVPFRPNKPRIQLLGSGCRVLRLNMSDEDTATFRKYRYGVLKYTEGNDTLPELLFTGNLSVGVNTVRYLKEGKKYKMKIWGVNSENSNTPLISFPFETASFCAREITIVTVSALALIIVIIMVIVVVNRRIQKKDAMYTYTMNPTGDSVFNDPLEDDISIIHINHDQATVVKPSRNVLLRLKLSLGLKRLK